MKIEKRNATTNIIRIFAAILVIYSHSFSIAQNKPDYLDIYTKNQINFGAVAVAILFCISGYYITLSIINKGLDNFLTKRILRLVPSLFITVILSIFLLGLFLSDLSFIKYLTNIQTYKYMLNIIFIPIHNLPGVFESNIFGRTVNGALWTMMVQFCCYVYCFINYKIRLLDKKNLYKYLFISILIYLISSKAFIFLNLNILLAMLRPFMCFIVGSCLYFYDFKDNKRNFIFMLTMFIICILLNNSLSLNIGLIVILSYITIYLCVNYNIVIKNKTINYILSSSYELYLVGFPIQQALTNTNGGSMPIFQNFLIGLFLSSIVALLVKYLSDYAIKKLNI